MNRSECPPQIDALPADKTLAVSLDLQKQLLKAGWARFGGYLKPLLSENSTFSDAMKNRRESRIDPWRAGDKYHMIVDLHCFRPDDDPRERYLITLGISAPFLEVEP